jgi:class 3 adenylate cyclase
MRDDECAVWTVTALVDVRHKKGTFIPCEVTACGLRASNGILDSYILFLTDKRPATELISRIGAAKVYADSLMNQLIPRDVQGFIRDDRKDFSFVAKYGTVVAIEICGFYEMLRRMHTSDLFPHFKSFYNKLNTGCVQHPPLVRQCEISDTFIAAAGLFTADDPKVHATAALELAQVAFTEAQHLSQSTGLDLRVQIGIAAGGPLLCGLVGDTVKSFTATGTVVEDAMTFADLSLPGHVLTHVIVKDLLPEFQFSTGPALPDGSEGWLTNGAVADPPATPE